MNKTRVENLVGTDGNTITAGPASITLGNIPKDRVDGLTELEDQVTKMHFLLTEQATLISQLVDLLRGQQATVNDLCNIHLSQTVQEAYRKLAAQNIYTDQEIYKILGKQYASLLI